MKNEIRTVVYDDILKIEAYHFAGIVQPFPNHFHEHYVIGFVEKGERTLSCKNIEYRIGAGAILLFHPEDNYACVQSDGKYLQMPRQKEIEKACDFIRRHYPEPIRLEQICHYAGLSKSTLLRAFIRLKGITPYRYLETIRINEAKALLMACPKKLKTADYRQELTFVLAGLCGICLYYLLENIALTFTLASNVGVIISIAPFFTAILAHFFIHSEEKLRLRFFLGFLVAMTGIFLISFNGAKLQLNPMGDLLAVAAALVWAFYSILTRKISSFGYPVILATRRTFFYGILFMIPALGFFHFKPDFSRFANATSLFNILYLGLGASALCFVIWNYAVKELGAIKTSVYIYMVPVITVLTSVVILKEPLTLLAGIGTVLTLIGLFLSEHKNNSEKFPT